MIRVLFFASVRDAVGVESLRCQLCDSEPWPFEALFTALQQQLHAAAYASLMADHIRVAVNRTFVDRADLPALASGDEVAFMPPITGG